MKITAFIRDFFSKNDTVAHFVENELSLQLELALAMRTCGFNVKFEQDMKFFDGSGVKKRLDLLVFDNEHTVAIELKLPRNGRVPETMFDFVKDVRFCEQIFENRMAHRTIAVLLTDDPKFWSGKSTGIYAPFRNVSVNLHGNIEKPTGQSLECIKLSNIYNCVWDDASPSFLNGKARFLLLNCCDANF